MFPKQKAVGRRFSFIEHQPDLLGHLTARGLLYKCICATPSFLHVTSTYRKHASVTSLLDLPLVNVLSFLEGVLASPDSGHVRGSLGSNNALSSHQARGLSL
jgi:hypothetical protein